MKTRPAVLLPGLAALLSVGAGPSFDTRPGKLPPLVFVSRQPVPTTGAAHGSIVPGLGPMDRTRAPGGTLLQRDRDGRLRRPGPGAGRVRDEGPARRGELVLVRRRLLRDEHARLVERRGGQRLQRLLL